MADDYDPDLTIVVDELDSDITEDDLEAYFESEDASGGTEVIGVNIDFDCQQAFIVFDDENVVDTILSIDHELNGKALKVRSFKEGPTPSPSATVHISGLKDGSKQSTVKMYFENKRRGGKIESIQIFEGGSAVIKFDDIDDAVKVVNSKDLLLSGQTLHVAFYDDKSPFAFKERIMKTSKDGGGSKDDKGTGLMAKIKNAYNYVVGGSSGNDDSSQDAGATASAPAPSSHDSSVDTAQHHADKHHCRSNRIRPKHSTPDNFSMTLQIYATSADSINQAIDGIDSMCKNETVTNKLDKQRDKDAIVELFPTELKKIERLETKYPCKIKIETRNEKVIEVVCNVNHEDSIMGEIRRLLKHVDDEAKQEEYAATIFQGTRWKYHDNNGQVQPYSLLINQIIEIEYQNNPQGKAKWTGDEDVPCEIDFIKMEEKSKLGKRKVERHAEETGGTSIQLPQSWVPMKDNELVRRVPLSKSSPEYDEVLKNFEKSVQPLNTTFQIISIDRVQNRILYQQYQVQKQLTEKQNPPGTQNEQMLWHGCRPDTVDKINKNGFNRSFAGLNAGINKVTNIDSEPHSEPWFGRGVYFASEATYPCHPRKKEWITTPDPQGNRYVYRCRVLTGVNTLGKKGMRAPPPRPDNPNLLYDCLTNDVNTTPNLFREKEFVIFHDAKAFPEYLIVFK